MLSVDSCKTECGCGRLWDILEKVGRAFSPPPSFEGSSGIGEPEILEEMIDFADGRYNSTLGVSMLSTGMGPL